MSSLSRGHTRPSLAIYKCPGIVCTQRSRAAGDEAALAHRQWAAHSDEATVRMRRR
jgi:hypothetical protein